MPLATLVDSSGAEVVLSFDSDGNLLIAKPRFEGEPDVAQYNPDSTGAGASVYEPAAGKIWRIHTLWIQNNDGANRDFSISQTDGSVVCPILPSQTIAHGATYLWEFSRDIFFSNSVGIRIYTSACTATANIVYRIAYDEYDT